MQSIAWWPTLIVLIIATVTDIRSRRIPNWLVLPFLVAGIIASGATGGLAGIGRSLAGVGLACGVMGILCYLRAMGMGDLKLCAAVGAWIGPSQLITALVAMAIVGGILAVVYGLRYGALGSGLDGVGDLVAGFARRGLRPHPTIRLDNPAAVKIPYAMAIAVGTMFSFCTL